MQPATIYNKREKFNELVEGKLEEIRRLCNLLRIPFVWVAAVGEDGEKTDYTIAIDANQEEDDADQRYICNGLTPGSMDINLSDDKIREIIKVMNGFKAVPKNIELTISEDDIHPVSHYLRQLSAEEEDGGQEPAFLSENDMIFESEEEPLNVSYRGMTALGNSD